MTACLKCGHDPAAVVAASWSFDIPREIGTVNTHAVNGRFGWKYRRDRDGWADDFMAIRVLRRIPVAQRKRRVTLTRLYNGRQQEMDARNMDFKACVDAMKIAGLLVDDNPAMLEDHYQQERSPTRGVRVLVEELAS